MVSFTLIANSIVVSASVLPCMQDDGAIQSFIETSAEPSCHEEQTPIQHEQCQDACYCIHFSSNQFPNFNLNPSTIELSHFNPLLTNDKHLISRIPPPLFRPPIHIS